MSFDLATARRTVSWQGVSVGVVALVASATLVFANALTRGPIAEAEIRDLQISLAQVLPEGFADNDLLKDSIDLADGSGGKKRVYLAKKNAAITGVLFAHTVRGYSGDIVVLMGIDTEGRIIGVRVIKHTETPGLGDKIELSKARWVLGFDGKSFARLPPAKWAVKKDGGAFDQFAGATITPRAVVKAVKNGLEFFTAHRTKLLAQGKAS